MNPENIAPGIAPLQAANSPVDAEQYNQLLLMFVEQGQDLKTIKATIFRILKYIGFMNADDSFREKLDMKVIMSVAMKATTQPEKFKLEMAFLSDLVPLIEKYRDL